MTTLMRNGRDRRSGKPVKCHARKERVLLVGTRSADHIRASGQSGCIVMEVRPPLENRPNTSMDGPTLRGSIPRSSAFDRLQSSIRSHTTLMGSAEQHPNIERSQASDVSVGLRRSSVRQPICHQSLITFADLSAHTQASIVKQLPQRRERDRIVPHAS
jgi:hypothetical protein